MHVCVLYTCSMSPDTLYKYNMHVCVLNTCTFHQVNYTPYFYEVFLKYTVDDNKTVVVYEASEINISLFKVAPLIWEELSDPSAVDRSKR